MIDGLGRVLLSKDVNDPSTAADDVVNHRAYDSLGRLKSEGFSDNSTGTKWTVTSLFDAAGRRSSVSYPAFGSAPVTNLTLTFDDLSRVRTLIDDHGTAPDETIATFAYVGSNRMVKSTRADGTTWTGFSGTTTSWDAAGRRTQGAVKKPDLSVLFEEEIKYTIRDEVLAVVWSHGRAGNESEAQTYSFDDLGRLTGFKQGLWDGTALSGQGDVSVDGSTNPRANVSWNLDELGNWRTHQDTLDPVSPLVPDLDGSNNFYKTFPTAFDTNADGTVDQIQNLTLEMDEASGFIVKRDEELSNSTAIKWLEYKHDLLGRLVEVKRKTTSPSTTSTVLAQYGYDSSGRLAWRCSGGCGDAGVQRKWLVYDGTQLVREGTGADGVAPDGSYVWMGSTLLKATNATGVESYLHQDRLGSVVLQTRNNAGNVDALGRATYDPYGRPLSIAQWAGAPLTVPYGYAGARREDAVGLYLMGARWYDPTLGRFIEQDPIGEAGGMNLYAYTASSPVMWTDPSGLAAEPNKTNGGTLLRDPTACGARCQAASLTGFKQSKRDSLTRARDTNMQVAMNARAATEFAATAGLDADKTRELVDMVVKNTKEGNGVVLSEVGVGVSAEESNVAALSSNGDFWSEGGTDVQVRSGTGAPDDSISVTGVGLDQSNNAITNVRSLVGSQRFQLSLLQAASSLLGGSAPQRVAPVVIPIINATRIMISVNRLFVGKDEATAEWHNKTNTVWLSWRRLFDTSGNWLDVKEAAMTLAHEYGHVLEDRVGWKPARCSSCEDYLGGVKDDDTDVQTQRVGGYVMEAVFGHYWSTWSHESDGWSFRPSTVPQFHPSIASPSR